MVRLGDVCEISSSKANLTDDKIWLLNLDMVEQQTGKIISYYYVNKNELNGSITQFDTENILYSKLRPNLNKVVVPDRNGFSTSELLPLKPNSKILCREYLALYLRSDSFVSWAISKTAGAKMPRLGTKALLDKEIPLPPLDEQRRIAATLDKVTDLISKRRQQLDKLDELVKARFVEMFGDPESNDKNWPVLPMSKICSVGSSKRIYQSEQSSSGVPFWRISDLTNLITTGTVTSELYIPEERYKKLKSQGQVPAPGDILITSRGTLGQCYIVKVNDKFYFQDGMISWLSGYVDGVTPLYISYLFMMPGFRKQIDSMQAGSTVAYLSIAMIKKLKVMLPDIESQQQFASFVGKTEKAKTTISRSLEKLETLKKALMQECFG